MIEPEVLALEIAVDAPVERVWSALSEPAEIRRWFGWEYEGLDDEIQEIFLDRAERFPPGRLALADGSALLLAADGTRTLVQLVVPGDGDDGFNVIVEGWRAFLEQLRFLLERRPAGPRRTVYLTGAATGGQLLAALPPGSSSWHDSRYLRMVVDGAGHLLAALAERPLASAEVSPVSLTVTSYGLDDAAAAQLRDEWGAHWQAVLPPAPSVGGSGE
ncbi:SRPBCC domain-containing protein [Micromonospora costi]|uniref:SRPBCC family protein n=1 Tax=Micromonospora costi TaxID=1530042 RepID=UPI00340C55A9